MNIFKLLFLIGVARDLADSNFAADVHEIHHGELADHPWRSKIEALGTVIFTERIEISFGRLYAWFFANVRNTNPRGTAMTYILRYFPEHDHGELPQELRGQMEKILQLLEARDPRVIAEIETAIRMV